MKNLLKKIGVVFLALIVIGVIRTAFGDKDATNTTSTNNTNVQKLESKVQVNVVDFSNMNKVDITNWCSTFKVECYTKDEYSDTVAKGVFVGQSSKSGSKVFEGDSITIIYSLGKKPSKEYKNALKSAQSYSDNMHMSKIRIYDQLVSEYGEQFPKDAAQYAIDNVVADWNANALDTAKSYQDSMNMSKKAIYDQLISKYGEQFTKTEAQYAIDHLDD